MSGTTFGSLSRTLYIHLSLVAIASKRHQYSRLTISYEIMIDYSLRSFLHLVIPPSFLALPWSMAVWFTRLHNPAGRLLYAAEVVAWQQHGASHTIGADEGRSSWLTAGLHANTHASDLCVAALQHPDAVLSGGRRRVWGTEILTHDFRPRSNSRAAADGAGSQFVKKLDDLYPRARCLVCKGLREVPCGKCGGRGGLVKGGYQRSNPVAMDRIVGSKWTAMERTFGRRHFVVSSKRKASHQGQGWFVEMAATCDDTCRFWVNAKNLKDRERWSMGWLQKSEMLAPEDQGQLQSVCKACKGQCRVPCGACASPDVPHLDIIHV